MASKEKVFLLVNPVICLLLVLCFTSVRAQEKIVLDGSTGMLPLARALAKAYQAKYTESLLELGNGLGTGARIRALTEDKIQIALASHGIDPEDVRKRNLKVLEVAKGAIVFAVNATVPLTGRSVIFTAAKSTAGKC